MMNEFLGTTQAYLVTIRDLRIEVLFYKKADYRYYLRLLRKYKRKFGVQVFAFCLISGAVYLILHPRQAADLSLFIRAIQQDYLKYFNDRYPQIKKLYVAKSETRAISLDQELFDAIKLVEFVPVMLAMVKSPVLYPWSSCSYRILARRSRILDARINGDVLRRGERVNPLLPPDTKKVRTMKTSLHVAYQLV